MKIAFAVTTYKDRDLAEVVFAGLDKFYPEAQVLRFDDLAERLKLPQFAGRWTERYLKGFLDTDADILIKLDPDAVVLRRALSYPDADVFGQIIKPQVLGGCIGYSKAGARTMVLSGLLCDTKYCGSAYTYPRFGGKNLKPGEAEDRNRVSLQDAIVGDVIERLALRTAEWSESLVRSWHPQTSMPTGDYAFVHPRS